MIADTIIKLVESSIDVKKQAEVVPRDRAYPTSGKSFIRISGVEEQTQFKENTIKIIVSLSITVSSRTSWISEHEMKTPYYEIIHLAESIFFHLLTNDALLSSIRSSLPSPLDFSSRFTSDRFSLRPEPVTNEFYGERLNSKRPIAGLKLTQIIDSPVFSIPLQCGKLPENLNNLIFS